MESDEDPECPVCNEFYTIDGSRRPKIIDCGHSLCGECFDDARITECPVCRGSLPEVANFNFSLIEVIRSLHNKKPRKEVQAKSIREREKELEEFKKLLEEEKEREIGLIRREKFSEVRRVTEILKREKEQEILFLKREQERERSISLKQEQQEKRNREREILEKLRKEHQKRERIEKEKKILREKVRQRKSKENISVGRSEKEQQEKLEAIRRVEEFKKYENSKAMDQVMEKARLLALQHVDQYPPTEKELLEAEPYKPHKSNHLIQDSMFLPKNYTGEKGRKKSFKKQ